MSPQSKTAVEHSDDTGNFNKRFLHRHTAAGKIHAEKNQRKGHQARRKRSYHLPQKPRTHNRLPRICDRAKRYAGAHAQQLPRHQDIHQRLLRLDGVRRLRQSDVPNEQKRSQRSLPLRRIPQARLEGLHQSPHTRGHARRDRESISANGARHFLGNDR